MKILVLKPSSLGDVVHALPVARLLKRQLPESRIHWWIETRLKGLLEDDPDLTGLYTFDRSQSLSPQACRHTLRSIVAMRQERFDWILDLQSLARSAAVAWLAKGERVIGLADPREGAPMFHDVSVPRPSPQTHAVDWYLEVVRALGLIVDRNFTWLPVRPAAAAAVESKWHPAGRRWVLLQPGARWINKRWPADSYGRLIRELGHADQELHFAVLGSEQERDLGATISRAWPERVLDLTGQLSLAELVEWLRIAALLVSNDSGPMHLAVAVDTPVVALFGPTSPQRTGPYGQTDHVLQLDLPCVPCLKSSCHWVKFMECLVGLPVETVTSAVLKRLKEPQSSFLSRMNLEV